MLMALILIPLAAGLAALFWPENFTRRALLLATAGLHLLLVGLTWAFGSGSYLEGWIELDASGKLFLTLASLLFFLVAIYCEGYLRREHSVAVPGVRRHDARAEQTFTGCLLLLLASMTLVCTSQHLGLLWVAVEATTLASAPLIYFHRYPGSLEATWKYLLLCSVGIALALLGTILLAVATHQPNHEPIPLTLRELLQHAASFDAVWLKSAFLFLLVGYGTKMGLAPMHNWKPDAYAEAPSMVAALLSGALSNCALLGILRIHQVCLQAGVGGFSSHLLIGFGLLSMTIAAIFLVGQPNYKRMLAYSSVEHMGIMAIGFGLGGAGLFAAALHAVNHSFTKGFLFLVAGNIVAATGSKNVSSVRGLVRMWPVTGVLWLLGFLAITGSPPFGTFLSEYGILKAAFETGYHYVGIAYAVLLCFIFVGMANNILPMSLGPASEKQAGVPAKEPLWSILPPCILAGCVLVLGFYIPPALNTQLLQVAQTLGGR